jgi:hypothetical protein
MQPVIPQVDSAQLLQTLMNQLAKPVESAAIKTIGWSADRTSSTCCKYTRFFWDRDINGTESIAKDLRRTTSRDSS